MFTLISIKETGKFMTHVMYDDYYAQLPIDRICTLPRGYFQTRRNVTGDTFIPLNTPFTFTLFVPLKK